MIPNWPTWYNCLVKVSWTTALATMKMIWQFRNPSFVVTFGLIFSRCSQGRPVGHQTFQIEAHKPLAWSSKVASSTGFDSVC